MSYSIDVNVLLHASDSSSEYNETAREFLSRRTSDPELFCLTWPTLMAYQRIATHPGIFSEPLSPAEALANIENLLRLPRTRVITEQEGFPQAYAEVTGGLAARGNFVPDAHVAAILRQHDVHRIYTADADFRKFDFLEVVNPFD